MIAAARPNWLVHVPLAGGALCCVPQLCSWASDVDVYRNEHNHFSRSNELKDGTSLSSLKCVKNDQNTAAKGVEGVEISMGDDLL